MTDVQKPAKKVLTEEEKEKKREYMRNYMRKYMAERREKDENFKKSEDERLRKYYIERYNNDPEWREKKRQGSKALYHKYRDAYVMSQQQPV